MAGIEKSLQIIEKDREMLFAAYSRRLAEFRDKTKNLKTLQVLQPSDFSKQEAFSFDPGKLLILTGNSMSGQALQEILLQEYGLQMEMASGNYVVAMTSIMDTDEGFARLSDFTAGDLSGTKNRHDDRSGTGRRTKNGSAGGSRGSGERGLCVSVSTRNSGSCAWRSD